MVGREQHHHICYPEIKKKNHTELKANILAMALVTILDIVGWWPLHVFSSRGDVFDYSAIRLNMWFKY